MLPFHVQNVSCISLLRLFRAQGVSSAENQLSVALALSSALHLFLLLPHAVHRHVLVFICPPLCCLSRASLAWRFSFFLSLPLPSCITRRCAMCSFAQACAAEERARVQLCAKKCNSLRKSASERACGLAQHRIVYTCTCIGRERVGNRRRQRRGDRQATRSLAFTRSVARWKHLRYREADLNRCRGYRDILRFMIPPDDDLASRMPRRHWYNWRLCSKLYNEWLHTGPQIFFFLIDIN